MPKVSDRKAREVMILNRLEQKMAPHDIIRIRLEKLFDAAIKHEERVQFAEGLERLDLIEEIDQSPELFRAKRSMLPLLINKILPTKLEHTMRDERAPRVTADQLEGLGLTDDQIKKLAGLGGEVTEIEDAEVVE
jgi:hypothetical protein